MNDDINPEKVMQNVADVWNYLALIDQRTKKINKIKKKIWMILI